MLMARTARRIASPRLHRATGNPFTVILIRQRRSVSHYPPGL